MTEAMWIKLIGTLPGLLWVALATTIYVSLRGSIVQHVVPRVTALRAMGVEVEVAGQLLDQAIEHSDHPVTSTARRGALTRLEHAADSLKDGKILWVDDSPENNDYLIDLFRSVGMRVDTARSTSEALSALRRGSYDIILSDMERQGDGQAGISLLRELESAAITLPVLIHAAAFDPELGLDRRIFAAAGYPVEVVHYVIDLRERVRFGPPTPYP